MTPYGRYMIRMLGGGLCIFEAGIFSAQSVPTWEWILVLFVGWVLLPYPDKRVRSP